MEHVVLHYVMEHAVIKFKKIKKKGAANFSKTHIDQHLIKSNTAAGKGIRNKQHELKCVLRSRNTVLCENSRRKNSWQETLNFKMPKKRKVSIDFSVPILCGSWNSTFFFCGVMHLKQLSLNRGNETMKYTELEQKLTSRS
jgi:hypothetical protein